MTITREYLATKLARRFGLTAADARKLVDLFFEEIGTSLIRGEEVKIKDFGTFKIHAKSSRMGRNPRTGEPKEISARCVPAFKPATAVRKRIKAPASL